MVKEFDLFHNEKELEELTGLSKEGLKENGFHVDCYDGDDKLDFYGGIRLKESESLQETRHTDNRHDLPEIEGVLLNKVSGWGRTSVKYGGYIYYLSHSGCTFRRPFIAE